MITRAAAKHRPQIQGLQCVGKKVAGHESKYFLSHVVVVAQTAGFGVGRGRRHRAGSIVLGIDRVGVEAQLVMQSLTRTEKSDSKVRGLAVAAGERESKV